MELPESVRFHYLKGNQYRNVFADGVIGGPTPSGKLHLSFYVERIPIPDQTASRVLSTGEIGEDIPELKITREGMLRELEFGLMVDIEFAKKLRDWLDRNIHQVETVTQAIEQMKAKPNA